MPTDRPSPPPENAEAMSAAWDDPVAFAREVSKYNQQLIDQGYAPVWDYFTVRDDYLN